MIVETQYGNVEFRIARFDTDGTNLEEGVEVCINGKLKKELYGERMEKFINMSFDEIDEWLKENIEFL